MEELARVDPSDLKHDEKLAFWINLYNALLMHVSLMEKKMKYLNNGEERFETVHSKGPLD